MIILDTNVVSEFSRRIPDSRVSAWLARQQFGDLATCSPVIAELAYGAHPVLKRDRSDRYLTAMERVIGDIVERRVFDFDLGSARAYGELRASEELAGRPGEHFDLDARGDLHRQWRNAGDPHRGGLRGA